MEKVMKHKGEREIHRDRLLATFALATLIFIAGILIGNAITSGKLANIENIEDKLRFDIMSLELESEIAKENSCSAIPTTLEEQLSETTTKISLLEDQLGKNNPRVLELKKYYSLLEIRHYLFMQDRKIKCGDDYELILFFYSNRPESIDTSEKQGYVLNYLKDKYGMEKIKIYSLDYDLELGAIRSLIQIYSITEAPSIVADESVYQGFRSKEELESFLR
ncbi:MAG: hypothetical protein WC475_04500 [Candidatus Paceibacterota bacterium]